MSDYGNNWIYDLKKVFFEKSEIQSDINRHTPIFNSATEEFEAGGDFVNAGKKGIFSLELSIKVINQNRIVFNKFCNG